MAGAGLPPVGVAWMVHCLPSISSCSAWERTELRWMWSIPSRGTAREEVLWSLAVLVVILLMRRLLMRVFFVGLRSLVYPWAEARPLKGPRSRWTRIPQYPEHQHIPPPWATLACWFRTTSLVYLFGISPTPSDFDSSLVSIFARLNTLETHTACLKECYGMMHEYHDYVPINSKPSSWFPMVKITINGETFHAHCDIMF
jgi:hypothetical protein